MLILVSFSVGESTLLSFRAEPHSNKLYCNWLPSLLNSNKVTTLSTHLAEKAADERGCQAPTDELWQVVHLCSTTRKEIREYSPSLTPYLNMAFCNNINGAIYLSNVSFAARCSSLCWMNTSVSLGAVNSVSATSSLFTRLLVSFLIHKSLHIDWRW